MAEQTSRGEKSFPENRREQNRHIRAILSEAFHSSGLTKHQLHEAINKESGFEISYNTLAPIIESPTEDGYDLDKTINLYAVIALCRYYHLDTAYVLSPPGTATPPMSPVSELIESSKFFVLDDPKYCGLFHGYLFVPNQRREEFMRFDLEIRKTESSCTAKMTYYGFSNDPGSEKREDTRILYGTPICSAVSSNIFILFTNDTGDFYFMYYDRRHFRSTNLYFRRGLIATSSTIGGYEPLFQSFVLFSRKLEPEKEVYVKGLLALNQTFYVSKDVLTQMCEAYPVVNEFCKANASILKRDRIKEVFAINEPIFLWNPADNERTDDIRALMLLKAASLFPPRVVFTENELISKFCKDYLLNYFDNREGGQAE